MITDEMLPKENVQTFIERYEDPENPNNPRLFWEVYIRMLSNENNAVAGTDSEACAETEEISKLLNKAFSAAGAKFTITEDGKGIISNYFRGIFKTTWNDEDFPEFDKGQENIFEGIFTGEESYSIVAASSELNICRWIYNGDKLISFEDDLQNCERKFLDAYGNYCSLNDDAYGLKVSSSEYSINEIFSLPVEQMLDPLMADDVSSEDLKFPEFMHMAMMYRYNCSKSDFSEYLHDNGAYLLDKNGNKITSLKDFHHSEPDNEGYIRYPVTASDLQEPVTFAPKFTEEAEKLWRKKIE